VDIHEGDPWAGNNGFHLTVASLLISSFSGFDVMFSESVWLDLQFIDIADLCHFKRPFS